MALPLLLFVFASRLHGGLLKGELLTATCVLCSVAMIGFCSTEQALPYVRRMDCGAKAFLKVHGAFPHSAVHPPDSSYRAISFPVSVFVRLPLTPLMALKEHICAERRKASSHMLQSFGKRCGHLTCFLVNRRGKLCPCPSLLLSPY